MSTVVQEDLCNIVERMGDSFSHLKGKTILITGGTGFIGTHLLETIAFLNDKVHDTPCRVFATARNPGRFSAQCPHLALRKDIILLAGDVRAFNPPMESCDFIVHAASPADPRVAREHPLETMDVIVEGTRKVLDWARQKKVERLLFLSSGAVYGAQPPDLARIPEDYCGGPNIKSGSAGYGEAKRYAEVLCQAFQESTGIPVSVARLFAFIGPYQDLDAEFAAVEFIRRSLRGEKIRIKGDGKAIRTLCYSADMTVALWKILLHEERNTVYNVGSDRDAVSVEELARRIAKMVSPSPEIVIEGRLSGDSARPTYIPDITKLKQETGFSLHFDLHSSLVRTLRHLFEEGHSSGVELKE